jgi:DNA-directed RNA polymerase specialized sigma24 family protein
MENQLSRKKDWVLTPDAFERLLAFFDPDTERAGQKYERVRAKLTKFFQWRGVACPEQYADKTIDRGARRLQEGVAVRVVDPYLYFHGIAVKLLNEYWRDPERDGQPLDGRFSGPATRLSPDPETEREQEIEHNRQEIRLDCLDDCMSGLPAESIDLITAYHSVGEVLSKNARKHLARSLGIPLNALRIRAFRIRTALERCVTDCMNRADMRQR